MDTAAASDTAAGLTEVHTLEFAIYYTNEQGQGGATRVAWLKAIRTEDIVACITMGQGRLKVGINARL